MKKCFFRSLCAFLLCLSLLTAAVPTRATGNPYFMAVNDNLLELKDQFIPIVANGQYYVPYTVLDSNVTGLELGVFPIYNSLRNTLVIYSRDQVLSFDLATGICTNRNNAVLAGRSVIRDGQIYVPARFICEQFSLALAIRNTTYGPLVRIRSSSSILDDDTFVGLAQIMMEDRLREWRKSQTAEEPAPSPSPAVTATPSPTVTAPPSTTPNPAPDKSGVRTYLSFRADQVVGLETLCTRLEQYQVKALFFFPASELADYDAAVRAVLCRGHAVGLLVSGSEPEEIAAQASEGNRMLAQIAHLNTNTVLAPDVKTAAAHKKLKEAGLFCLEPDVDALPDGRLLAVQANAVMKDADRYSREVHILFDTTSAGVSLLSRVLPELVQNGYDLRLAVETEL